LPEESEITFFERLLCLQRQGKWQPHTFALLAEEAVAADDWVAE
jgi:hypothetical protein